jgi:hypothetical protein
VYGDLKKGTEEVFADNATPGVSAENLLHPQINMPQIGP